MNIRDYKNIYMIGIGGISMSGIAEILVNWGFKVSGSDMSESAMTEKLRSNGINVNIGQVKENITKDIVLFNTIINNFPSFADTRTYDNKTIYFYKLAQLLTSDILHIRSLKEGITVDYSNLVGCADYKIPQVLRSLGVLVYDKELSDLVDNKNELEENSIYEVEIRANMVVAINLIKKELNNKVSAIDINDTIWSFSQDKTKKLLPYHLTRTLSY